MNGETVWVLTSDAQTRMLHGDTPLSKSSPVKYFKPFLQQYFSECKNKWVVLDQGGELYGNPDLRNLFKQYQYEIHPSGEDSSSQNSPVERARSNFSDGIKSFFPVIGHSGANVIENSFPLSLNSLSYFTASVLEKTGTT